MWTTIRNFVQDYKNQWRYIYMCVWWTRNKYGCVLHSLTWPHHSNPLIYPSISEFINQSEEKSIYKASAGILLPPLEIMKLCKNTAFRRAPACFIVTNRCYPFNNSTQRLCNKNNVNNFVFSRFRHHRKNVHWISIKTAVRALGNTSNQKQKLFPRHRN